jgi:hypothetical protein
MKAQPIHYITLAAVTIAGIYLWVSNPGLPGKHTLAPAAPMGQTTETARVPADAITHYRSVLVAKHRDAWKARRQLELRHRALSSLAAVQGGTIRLGGTRYTRTRDTAEFEIRQQITVTLPSGTNWGQIRQDLLRLSRHAPRIDTQVNAVRARAYLA